MRKRATPRQRQTVCRRGHDLTIPKNVYTSPAGGEIRCRACKADRERERNTRRRLGGPAVSFSGGGTLRLGEAETFRSRPDFVPTLTAEEKENLAYGKAIRDRRRKAEQRRVHAAMEEYRRRWDDSDLNVAGHRKRGRFYAA